MEYELIKQPKVFPERILYQSAKRFLDLSMTFLSLPVLIPLMLACALAIRLDSPGPILFIQDRIGKGGRRFRLYKFRTMKADLDDRHRRRFMKAYIRGEVENSAEAQPTFKPNGANDVTRVGRFLRKTSLDEFPQLINVVRGEMSIVGPRPNVLWEVNEYRPWHHERLEVLPGITGLAQVRGRSCIDFNTLVRFDIAYIEKQSMLLDVKILWWTFLAVLRGIGAT